MSQIIFLCTWKSLKSALAKPPFQWDFIKVKQTPGFSKTQLCFSWRNVAAGLILLFCVHHRQNSTFRRTSQIHWKIHGLRSCKNKNKNLFFPRLKSLALNSPYIKKGLQAILMLTYEFEAVWKTRKCSLYIQRCALNIFYPTSNWYLGKTWVTLKENREKETTHFHTSGKSNHFWGTKRLIFFPLDLPRLALPHQWLPGSWLAMLWMGRP